MLRILLTAALLLALAPIPARADKTYTASEYRVDATVRHDGSLHVAEIATFRFEGGPFTFVFRDLPTRRTDGIEILRVAIDGEPLLPGSGPGRYQVERDRDGIKVTWRFDPVSDATRTFELVYTARGVAYRDGDVDRLAWQALPRKHDYRIERALVAFRWPGELETVSDPSVDAGRFEPDVLREPNALLIAGTDLRRDAGVTAAIAFPPGSLTLPPPAWQQRSLERASRLPIVLTVAGLAGAIPLLVGLFLWLQSPRGSGDLPMVESEVAPSDLSAAVAAALTNNGHPAAGHATGMLFELSARGVLEIREQSPGSRSRSRRFEVIRRSAGAPLEDYERIFLDAGFGGPEVDSVTLTKFLGRVRSKWSRIAKAIESDLMRRRLLDGDRQHARGRLMRCALVLLFVAVALVPAAIPFLDRFGPAVFLVPAAVGLASAIVATLGSTVTPLSDEGLRQRARWKGFRARLRAVSRGEVRSGAADAFERYLPFAAATGLGAAWLKHFLQERTGIDVPAWFQPVATDHDGRAAAMVAVYGSSAHASGSTSVSAGGAAGGGSSGAG